MPRKTKVLRDLQPIITQRELATMLFALRQYQQSQAWLAIQGGEHFEEHLPWLSFNASINSARVVVDRLVAQYGQRALMAESQQGVDWKAMSHAVRVGHEALEKGGK